VPPVFKDLLEKKVNELAVFISLLNKKKESILTNKNCPKTYGSQTPPYLSKNTFMEENTFGMGSRKTLYFGMSFSLFLTKLFP
jgi:hypothetical protein